MLILDDNLNYGNSWNNRRKRSFNVINDNVEATQRLIYFNRNEIWKVGNASTHRRENRAYKKENYDSVFTQISSVTTHGKPQHLERSDRSLRRMRRRASPLTTGHRSLRNSVIRKQHGLKCQNLI